MLGFTPRWPRGERGAERCRALRHELCLAVDPPRELWRPVAKPAVYGGNVKRISWSSVWVTFTAVVATTAMAPPAGLAQEPPAHLSVAVLDISGKGGIDQSRADLFAILLQDTLRNDLGYKVIGRADVEALLGLEQMKQMMNCEDDKCMAEIGGALGVNELIVGSVGRLGSYLVISLKRVDPNKALVVNQATVKVKDASDDDLVEAVVPLINELYHAKVTVKPVISKSAAAKPAPSAPAAEAKPPPVIVQVDATADSAPRSTPAPSASASSPVSTATEGTASAEPAPSTHKRWFWVGANLGVTTDAAALSGAVAPTLEIYGGLSFIELGLGLLSPSTQTATLRLWLHRERFETGVVARLARYSYEAPSGDSIAHQSYAVGLSIGMGFDVPYGRAGWRLEPCLSAGKNGLSLPVMLAAHYSWGL